MKILCIITGCGGGDWPPLLALAEGLNRRGHQLIVVCDRSTKEAVKAAGLIALCLPPVLALENVFEPAISRLLSQEENEFLRTENPLILWGTSSVDYIKNSLMDWRPSLVMSSLFGMGLGEILSKKFTAPRCFLNPSFNFSQTHDSCRASDFSQKGRLMYLHWLLPLAKTAHLVLHATDSVFDLSGEPLPPSQRYVGPLFWELSGNIPELLRKPGPPWILVTLSTSPQPEDLIIAKTALKALALMDVRVLLTIASGHNRGELGRLPDNSLVMGYIPHSKILPHCCLVISQAGHGIVMKAMAYGVPMVLVPWGRDQPGVASRARQLGTAEIISRETCSVTSLKAAIRAVLDNPVYFFDSKKQSDRFRNRDGVANAVRYIERFLDNAARSQHHNTGPESENCS